MLCHARLRAQMVTRDLIVHDPDTAEPLLWRTRDLRWGMGEDGIDFEVVDQRLEGLGYERRGGWDFRDGQWVCEVERITAERHAPVLSAVA